VRTGVREAARWDRRPTKPRRRLRRPQGPREELRAPMGGARRRRMASRRRGRLSLRQRQRRWTGEGCSSPRPRRHLLVPAPDGMVWCRGCEICPAPWSSQPVAAHTWHVRGARTAEAHAPPSASPGSCNGPTVLAQLRAPRRRLPGACCTCAALKGAPRAGRTRARRPAVRPRTRGPPRSHGCCPRRWARRHAHRLFSALPPRQARQGMWGRVGIKSRAEPAAWAISCYPCPCAPVFAVLLLRKCLPGWPGPLPPGTLGLGLLPPRSVGMCLWCPHLHSLPGVAEHVEHG